MRFYNYIMEAGGQTGDLDVFVPFDYSSQKGSYVGNSMFVFDIPRRDGDTNPRIGEKQKKKGYKVKTSKEPTNVPVFDRNAWENIEKPNHIVQKSYK